MLTILKRNKNSYKIVKNGSAAIYQINFKASVIMKKFVGIIFNLCSGKQYYVLPITNLMFGFKFGWFIHATRILNKSCTYSLVYCFE